jgi:predicted dehydrogenase
MVSVLTEWDAVEALKPEIAFITSPTAFHMEQAIACAKLGTHLFIEKPLASQLDPEAMALLKKEVSNRKLHLQVGYMMRYHPLLKKVREAVSDSRHGNLISFHSHWGEYLPDWHPWEDYRLSYAARRDLGGGAALTLSHDLDVALWVSQAALNSYHILKSPLKPLEIDVDGSTDILLRFQNGTIGHVHLNFVQQNPERHYEYRFENATLKVDFFANTLTILQGNEKEQKVLEGFDRNDLFLDQTNAFLEALSSPNTDYSLGQLSISETILSICNEKPLPSI